MIGRVATANIISLRRWRFVWILVRSRVRNHRGNVFINFRGQSNFVKRSGRSRRGSCVWNGLLVVATHVLNRLLRASLIVEYPFRGLIQ